MCEKCQYLMQNCVCALLPSNIDTDLEIIIFQSPNEAMHPKNSVKLLKLALPSIKVVPVISVNDILNALENLDLSKWCLIYPSDQAEPIEKMSLKERNAIEGVILIDATWRKAFALYHSYQDFLTVPTKSFLTPPKGEYSIRKTSKENALSTFEACVYTLESIERVDLSKVKTFFMQAQQWQWRKAPYMQ